MARNVTLVLGVAESAFVFASGNLSQNDDIHIGEITYTFKTDPTGVAYAVDVGADVDESISNLVAAINASGTDDVEYGAGTLANPHVSAVADLVNDEIDLTARVPGRGVNGTHLAANAPGANVITPGGDTFGEIAGATVGAGDVVEFIQGLLDLNQINAELLTPLNDFVEAVA